MLAILPAGPLAEVGDTDRVQVVSNMVCFHPCFVAHLRRRLPSFPVSYPGSRKRPGHPMGCQPANQRLADVVLGLQLTAHRMTAEIDQHARLVGGDDANPEPASATRGRSLRPPRAAVSSGSSPGSTKPAGGNSQSAATPRAHQQYLVVLGQQDRGSHLGILELHEAAGVANQPLLPATSHDQRCGAVGTRVVGFHGDR